MKISKIMFKKVSTVLAISSSLAVLSTSVSAQQFVPYEIPGSCGYGFSSSNGDVPVAELSAAVRDGAEAWVNPTPAAIAKAVVSVVDLIDGVFDWQDYLRIESPKHVLQNTNFRAKGNLFDPFANVRFYNSELGYVGTDKSSIESNAYKSMRFPSTYGVGVLWITRSNNSLCSMEQVYVQKPVRIQSANVRSVNDGSWNIGINYLVDKYSKAAINANQDVRITVSGRNSDTGGFFRETVLTQQLSGNRTFNMRPQSGGIYRLNLHISDGVYSKQISLGTQFSNLPVIPECPNCQLF